MTYQSQSAVIRTLRGAALWMAFWTTITALHVYEWPREDGLDVLRGLVVLLVQIAAPLRILGYLRSRERRGIAPGESESFLFDLALNAPLVIAVVVMLASTR